MTAIPVEKSLSAIGGNIALEGFSPSDNTKAPRILRFDFGPLGPIGVLYGITQRVEDPGSAPFAGGIEYVDHRFANEQDLLPPGPQHFTEIGGFVSLIQDGAYIRRGHFAGGGYVFGTRHYFEEGLILLQNPALPFLLGYHDQPATRGQLWILQTDPTQPYFPRHVLATAGGSPVSENVDFPELPVSVGFFSAASPPIWHYYHFARNYDPATDKHVCRMTIDGTTVEKLVNGLFSPATSSGLNTYSTDDIGAIDRQLIVAWCRAGWSDTQIVGPVGNSPWSMPVLYSEQTFQSHGDFQNGWCDSGAQDRYWSHLLFTDLRHQHGSTLQVRAVATNVVPPGDLSGLWINRPWVEANAGAPVTFYDPVLGFPQGRYLLLQFRFRPSALAALRGATSRFLENTVGDVLTAYANTVTPPAPLGPPIQISIGGEGFASQTLPVTPQYQFEKETVYDVQMYRYTMPYLRTFPTGTGKRRNWVARYTAITTAERNLLETFFRNRGGGAEPFFWTPEDATAPVSAVLLNETVEFTIKGPDVWHSQDFELLEIF